MKKRRAVRTGGLLLAVGMLMFGCSKQPSPTGSDDRNNGQTAVPKVAEVVAGSNTFGLDLFRRLAADTGNVFISPLSVSMALGMTYNGAEGSTEEAMQTTLGLDGLSPAEVNASYRAIIDNLAGLDPQVAFSLANSIWSRTGFAVEQDFIDLNRTYFDAEVRELDFDRDDAADTINGWVATNTNGKIEKIVDPPLDPTLVMCLINAVYFKGTWTWRFDQENTYQALFHVSAQESKYCDMMYQKAYLGYYETDDFQAVNLPYGNGEYSMTVILPAEDTDVDALTGRLTPETWAAWQEGFTQDTVYLYLPKWKLKYYNSLKDVLTAMGMGIAFTPGMADFSGINGGGGLYISEVKHKSFVEVNEAGTEAAAVTIVGISFTSLPTEPRTVMKVNRPFLFLIREHATGSILFAGKVADPTVE